VHGEIECAHGCGGDGEGECVHGCGGGGEGEFVVVATGAVTEVEGREVEE